MIIENSFTVPLTPDRALDMLTDVPAIAPCIPGVTLTGEDGAGAYRGTAAVRLGPVSLSFAGTARIVEIDRALRTAKVEAEGADQKGRGRARADVAFAIAPADAGTRVDVHADVTLTGQVAQYGRASGLIEAVAAQIIGAFVKNLEARLAEDGGGGGGGAAGAAATPPARKQEISGLTLLFKALAAMIAKLFRRPRRG